MVLGRPAATGLVDHGHRRQDRTRRRSRLIAGLVAVLVSAACSGPADHTAPAPPVAPTVPTPAVPTPAGPAPTPTVSSLTVAGQPALLLEPVHPNGRLVLFLHGASGRAGDLRAVGDRARADLAAGLVTAGYAVAASDAHGDAWGSAASVADYQALATEARRRTGASSVYLLAESMGGLPAAQLTAPGALADLHALAGIYPVCDLSSIRAGFTASIEAAYGSDTDAAVAALSPVRPDPAVPLLIWASADDTVVPTARNAEVCVADVLARGGEARLIPTVGDHGDPSNFALSDLLSFYDAAA